MKLKLFILLILLNTAPILRGYAQQENTEAPQEEASQMPQKGLDNIWRSSDLDGEQPVLRQQKRPKRTDGSAQLPEGSTRVGCICMDYQQQAHTGRGACSGHNGVRFWLYLLPSGDTVQIATLRHESHPDTLADDDILKLAAYKRYEKLMAKKQLDFFETLDKHPDWLDNIVIKNPSIAAMPDPLRLVLPPIMPYDNNAQNTLIYSLSVLIGSGGLYVLKKLTGIGSNKQDEIAIAELQEEPKDLI